MINNEHGTKKIFGVILPDWVDEGVLKKLIYGFLSLVLAILISVLFVWPRLGDLGTEAKELGKLKQTLDSLSSSMERIDEFDNNYQDEEMAVFTVAVPRVFDPGLILTSLRQVGANTGVVLEAYDIGGGEIYLEDSGEGVKKELVTLKKHKVNLRLVGRAENLIKYIDLLGTSLPLSIISNLSLSEVSNLLSQQGMSQLEMEVTYFESGLVGVIADGGIPEFTDENKKLFNEILSYSKPYTTVIDSDVQTERQGSIFGF